MKTNFSIVPQVLTKDPKTAAVLVRSFLGSKKSMIVDHARVDGRTNELGLMYFRLTPLCNLQCVMCGQRGTKGVLKGAHATEESKKIVPLTDYMRLVDQVAPKKPVIYLWGGEPFLYPDLFPLVHYMKKAGLPVSINTNGTHLAKHAEEIVRERWTAVFVSLDGFEETNDRIRGKGSYRRVVEGFQAINEEKRRQKSALPFMGIVTTVNNMNYKDLYRLADAARAFKLSWHIFNLGTYTNRSIIDAHKNFMMNKLGTSPDCLSGFETDFNTGIDGKELHGILTRIHALDVPYPIITVPTLTPEKIDVYYRDLETPVREMCSVPWSQCNVDYNGNVHFCADYPDYILGNIRDTDFWDIFNGERAVRFRKVLKETRQGMMPGCVRCYQNMLCGKRLPGF